MAIKEKFVYPIFNPLLLNNRHPIPNNIPSFLYILYIDILPLTLLSLLYYTIPHVIIISIYFFAPFLDHAPPDPSPIYITPPYAQEEKNPRNAVERWNLRAKISENMFLSVSYIFTWSAASLWMILVCFWEIHTFFSPTFW